LTKPLKFAIIMVSKEKGGRNGSVRFDERHHQLDSRHFSADKST